MTALEAQFVALWGESWVDSSELEFSFRPFLKTVCEPPFVLAWLCHKGGGGGLPIPATSFFYTLPSFSYLTAFGTLYPSVTSRSKNVYQCFQKMLCFLVALTLLSVALAGDIPIQDCGECP